MPDEVEDYLYRIDTQLRRLGLPEMDAPTLKEVHQRLSEPSVLQGLRDGTLTTQMLVQESMSAAKAAGMPLPTQAGEPESDPTDLTPFAEGMLVSRAPTPPTPQQQIRQRLRQRQGQSQ